MGARPMQQSVEAFPPTLRKRVAVQHPQRTLSWMAGNKGYPSPDVKGTSPEVFFPSSWKGQGGASDKLAGAGKPRRGGRMAICLYGGRHVGHGTVISPVFPGAHIERKNQMTEAIGLANSTRR